MVNYYDGNGCMAALNHWQNLLRTSQNFSHLWYIHGKTWIRISVWLLRFNFPSMLVIKEFYWVGLGPVSSWKDRSEWEVLQQHEFAQPLEAWMQLVPLHRNCFRASQNDTAQGCSAFRSAPDPTVPSPNTHVNSAKTLWHQRNMPTMEIIAQLLKWHSLNSLLRKERTSRIRIFVITEKEEK